MSRYKSDDITLLPSAMQSRVQTLMDRMTAQGFKPVLFDGMRTSAEAAKNAAKGTGIKHSMHELGLASDVICDEHGWTCAQHGCKFYTKLGAEAKALELVWGGYFPSVDQPHVQAVLVADQDEARATKPEDRNALIEAFFAKRIEARKILAGAASADEIKAFQTAAGLVADGSAGPKTLAAAKREARPY